MRSAPRTTQRVRCRDTHQPFRFGFDLITGTEQVPDHGTVRATQLPSQRPRNPPEPTLRRPSEPAQRQRRPGPVVPRPRTRRQGRRPSTTRTRSRDKTANFPPVRRKCRALNVRMRVPVEFRRGGFFFGSVGGFPLSSICAAHRVSVPTNVPASIVWAAPADADDRPSRLGEPSAPMVVSHHTASNSQSHVGTGRHEWPIRECASVAGDYCVV